MASAEPDGWLSTNFASLAVEFSELTNRQPEWQASMEGRFVQISADVERMHEEGRNEAGREDLRDILRSRFHPHIPYDLATAILCINEGVELVRRSIAAEAPRSPPSAPPFATARLIPDRLSQRLL